MEINNAIYEERGAEWWNDDAGFEFTSLRYCLNPVRYGYFKRHLQGAPAGGTVLDVGCGGGFLAEEFAKDGFAVTGIDPSGRSLEAARAHAGGTGLTICYRSGRGESLPFPDASFDIVCCCDVLEHVDDPARVLAEIARTLRPGGIFFFDTVNRTRASKLVLIKVWQDWDLGGFGVKNGHVWEKFITPAELRGWLATAGLAFGGITGLGASKNPAALLYGLWRIRRGHLRGAAVASTFAIRESGDLSVSYMGWASKSS